MNEKTAYWKKSNSQIWASGKVISEKTMKSVIDFWGLATPKAARYLHCLTKLIYSRMLTLVYKSRDIKTETGSQELRKMIKSLKAKIRFKVQT